jgi:GABA(A) receptor-associated protein
MAYTFKQINSLEKRLGERARLLEKYPDKIPVIIDKFSGDKTLPALTKSKYILAPNTTIGQLLYTIRCSLPTMRSSHALFLFISNTAPPTTVRLVELYDSFKDSDGFLYCMISSEATFGH